MNLLEKYAPGLRRPWLGSRLPIIRISYEIFALSVRFMRPVLLASNGNPQVHITHLKRCFSRVPSDAVNLKRVLPLEPHDYETFLGYTIA